MADKARGFPAALGLTAFLEGFSTLAVEIIAIRLAIPVVGSSATLTGVMLGVILFALSAGYWRGGVLSARWNHDRARSVLARNLWLAALIYVGIAFRVEAAALNRLLDAGLSLTSAIAVAAVGLFAPPVYLASQTVPMLAELWDRDGKAGKSSGIILFFSTIGSVAGGVLTPTMCFPAAGVRATTYIVSLLLCGAAFFIAFRHVRPRRIAAAAGLALLVCLAGWWQDGGNSLFALDTAHQSIRVREDPLEDGRVERVLLMDNGRASGIYTDTGEASFAVILEADKALRQSPCAKVLSIGAAGFVFPRDAARNPSVQQVDAVDVDPALRSVAEEHFLREPLPAKITFFPMSARDAVRRFHRAGARYGFTLIDAYCGNGIPEELLTVEFFSAVRAVSGRTAANIIMDRSVESSFSRNVLATFRQAFGRVWIKDVKPNGESERTNFFVTDWEWAGSTEWTGAGTVYTDDRNQADRDHVNLVWGRTEL